ncbi:hypothetical protein R3P38DRAFT_2910161 [Favolaschia claudopus]|uniref:Uncharacterized protein n=1 Tax=Favolaschia claudopus TaxID=2862362 RepID=A0AAW0CCV5_9AGAR
MSCCYYPAAPQHEHPISMCTSSARELRRPAQRAYPHPSDYAFVPGVYRLPQPPPTPSAILNGAYVGAEECIEYFPRRPQYCGQPCLSISFSVHGHPAPYLKDILKDRVLLDSAHDPIMTDQGWSRTRWILEWPGFDLPMRTLNVARLSRMSLAKEIATCVALFLREAAARPPPLGPDCPWSARNVHFGDVRLVAVNYYRAVWVPIFAFDATA